MDKIIEIQRKAGVARVKFLSGEELKIPSPLFVERRLRKGEMMDPAAYRMFMQQRGYPHALEAAMKYLALRERSAAEVRSRLKRSCYDEGTIERVLDALDAHGLVSDVRFAEGWAQSRSKKYGKARIAQELKIKGVENDQARQALDTISPEEEMIHALQQAKKMTRRLQSDPQKMIQALVRRGFAWPLAKKAVHQALLEENADGRG